MDAIASIDILKFLTKYIFFFFIFSYQVIKITTINFVFDTCTIRIFVWITQKVISEKWNLAVNFNCQEAKIITLLFAVMGRKWSVRTTYACTCRCDKTMLSHSFFFFYLFFACQLVPPENEDLFF